MAGRPFDWASSLSRAQGREEAKGRSPEMNRLISADRSGLFIRGWCYRSIKGSAARRLYNGQHWDSTGCFAACDEYQNESLCLGIGIVLRYSSDTDRWLKKFGTRRERYRTERIEEDRERIEFFFIQSSYWLFLTVTVNINISINVEIYITYFLPLSIIIRRYD